jgi:hypothetical protein
MAVRLHIMPGDGIDYQDFCRRGSHAGTLGMWNWSNHDRVSD